MAVTTISFMIVGDISPEATAVIKSLDWMRYWSPGCIFRMVLEDGHGAADMIDVLRTHGIRGYVYGLGMKAVWTRKNGLELRQVLSLLRPDGAFPDETLIELSPQYETILSTPGADWELGVYYSISEAGLEVDDLVGDGAQRVEETVRMVHAHFREQYQRVRDAFAQAKASRAVDRVAEAIEDMAIE